MNVSRSCQPHMICRAYFVGYPVDYYRKRRETRIQKELINHHVSAPHISTPASDPRAGICPFGRTAEPYSATTSERVMGIEASADVSSEAQIGKGTAVWHLAQIRESAQLGQNCVIGRGAYIGPGVQMGDNCKVQNYALVYEPALLEDGVFVGPAAVFTNDQYPRSVTPDGRLKHGNDWEPVGVIVRRGASIGARSVCVAPVTVGSWALVAAGSVVVRDVPDFAIVAGVPARQIGWVGRAGVPLKRVKAGMWQCPRTQETYVEENGSLTMTLTSPLHCNSEGSEE